MNTIKNMLAEEEAERRLNLGSASVASDSQTSLLCRPTDDSPNPTTRQAGQTRFDTIFEAILAKNILARQGGSAYSKDCLQSIERALSLAADLVGKRDDQPNVESVWDQNVI